MSISAIITSWDIEYPVTFKRRFRPGERRGKNASPIKRYYGYVVLPFYQPPHRPLLLHSDIGAELDITAVGSLFIGGLHD